MSNPRVRSGEINPSEINPQAALVAMMMDPGLIRGPLIRCGNRCSAGFDNLVMNKWVGATAVSYTHLHGIDEGGEFRRHIAKNDLAFKLQGHFGGTTLITNEDCLLYTSRCV